MNPIPIISSEEKKSEKKREWEGERQTATTGLCQWQFNPQWARCMYYCACSGKLSDCIWICADLVAAYLSQVSGAKNYTNGDSRFILQWLRFLSFDFNLSGWFFILFFFNKNFMDLFCWKDDGTYKRGLGFRFLSATNLVKIRGLQLVIHSLRMHHI